MASPVLIGIWFCLVFYQIFKWMFYKPPNFPPGKKAKYFDCTSFYVRFPIRQNSGPPRLPILGAYPYMLLLNYKHLHKAIDWLCKYYKTDVLGLYAANFPTVVANSTITAKELLNNPWLDGKPGLKLAQIRDPEFKVRGEAISSNYSKTNMEIDFRDFLYGRPNVV